jgi:hypothetical protein
VSTDDATAAGRGTTGIEIERLVDVDLEEILLAVMLEEGQVGVVRVAHLGKVMVNEEVRGPGFTNQSTNDSKFQIDVITERIETMIDEFETEEMAGEETKDASANEGVMKGETYQGKRTNETGKKIAVGRIALTMLR